MQDGKITLVEVGGLPEGKLDGMSYSLWKFNVAAILDTHDLLEMMLGIVDSEPQETPDLANPTSPNPDL